MNKAEIYKLEMVGVPYEIVEYFEDNADCYDYKGVTTYEKFSYQDKKGKNDKRICRNSSRKR